MQIQCNPYQILFAEMEKFSLKFKMKMPEALNSQKILKKNRGGRLIFPGFKTYHKAIEIKTG